MSQPARSAVAKVVKRVMNRNMETKFVGRAIVDADFNSSISSAAECYPVTPAVQLGDDDYQRTGDRIRPMWMTIRGKVMLSRAYLSALTVLPTTVRLMVLNQRDLKTNAQVATNADFAHILKDNINVGVARPYAGGNYDNLAPINRDKFQVIADKKYRFTWDDQLNLAGQAAAGTNKAFYFTIRVKVPKTMYFDDVNGANPTNFAPFLCCGCATDDNSGPYTLPPIHVTAQSILYFKDA